MGEFANKAIGRTKRVVGKVTRNRSLQAKGAVQETAGRVQGAGRRVRKAVRRTGRNVRGAASQARSRVRRTEAYGRRH
jgi:uncharacterized protein YjbJ (UPF0337 family)